MPAQSRSLPQAGGARRTAALSPAMTPPAAPAPPHPGEEPLGYSRPPAPPVPSGPG